ncbi:MAG: HU family DNA-binding protein [Bacillota bacterium]
MNKAELVDVVASKAGLSKKDSEKAVNAVIEGIREALARGEKVSLVGFGTFEVRERAARQGRNPRTGEKISIEATKVPVFRAGKILKDDVVK